MNNLEQNFSHAEMEVKKQITDIFSQVFGDKFTPDLIEVGYAPENQRGDFSVSCFLLAKKMKKSPAEVSSDFAKKVGGGSLVESIEAVGPYLNFSVSKSEFSKLVLSQISKEKQSYGSSKLGKGKKVMVEYFSPNTNKPLTIGHVRNITLGWSIARLLKFLGYKVTEATLYNDRGIAIAKAILGYMKWGKGQTPKTTGMKPDHFVGSFYVKFCQEAEKDESLLKEAKQVLKDWEAGKKEVIEVWQKLMSWVYEGYSATLEKLKISEFEEKYYESEYYNKGKDIIEKGLKRGVFKKDDQGGVIAPLEKFDLPEKVLLRTDGTSLYVTQDIYLAYLKANHNIDSSVYVVGSEQDLYFKQLFKTLELLEFKNIDNYHHLSYGMIRLPDGKIKSRQGLIPGTGADELIGRLEDMAAVEISSRFEDLKEKEVQKRAEKIAIAALKFYILAVNPKTTMVFDPQKSLAFIGKTGPYLQYVYARINSIFEKSKIKFSSRIDYTAFDQPEEFILIKTLAKFPLAVGDAAKNHDPSQLTSYLYDLAKDFSLFYEKVPVLKAESKQTKARLFLINNVKIVLAQGLNLLGIEAPEKM